MFLHFSSFNKLKNKNEDDFYNHISQAYTYENRLYVGVHSSTLELYRRRFLTLQNGYF